MIRVVKIIKDASGRHIGADIAQGLTMGIVSIAELSQLSVDNAIVSGGTIKAKIGSLPSRVANNVSCFYHWDKDIHVKPQFGIGRTDNAYGQGFYVTQDLELAKELSFSSDIKGSDNCVHAYNLDISDLALFNFDVAPIEWWIAELLNNTYPRKLDGYADWARAFIGWYGRDLSQYDIISGYRVDDSFISYVRSFVHGNLFMEDLRALLSLGKFGKQFCFRSKRAIDTLRGAFTGVKKVPKSYGSVVSAYSNYLGHDRNMRGHTILNYIRHSGTLYI